MIRFFLKKVWAVIPVAVGVVTCVALIIHAVPGDPVDTILGDYASAEDKSTLRTQLGLDQPAYQQLFLYFLNLLKGDLGNSLINQKPVFDLILERLPATLELAMAAIIVAILISIPLGILSAVRKDSVVDFGAMTLALIGVCIPNFWLGPLLVLLFSVHLGWLPVSERTDWDSYILPALTMGTSLAAILSRMTRTSMLGVLKENYIRTAKSKGLSQTAVLFKHALRNASLPLVTILGLQFGVLLTGAVVTERIFDWPGLGSLMIEALGNRDYPVVQGCVLLFSGSYLFVNLVTDICYGIVDPRIDINK